MRSKSIHNELKGWESDRMTLSKKEQQELLLDQLKEWTSKLHDLLAKNEIEQDIHLIDQAGQAVYQYSTKLKKTYRIESDS